MLFFCKYMSVYKKQVREYFFEKINDKKIKRCIFAVYKLCVRCIC